MAISFAMVVTLVAVFAAVTGNIGTAFAARKNCKSVEALKTQVREDARFEYRQTVLEVNRSLKELDRNAKLLGLPPISPEARKEATKQANRAKREARIERNETIAKFPARKCSIWLWE